MYVRLIRDAFSLRKYRFTSIFSRTNGLSHSLPLSTLVRINYAALVTYILHSLYAVLTPVVINAAFNA